MQKYNKIIFQQINYHRQSTKVYQTPNKKVIKDRQINPFFLYLLPYRPKTTINISIYSFKLNWLLLNYFENHTILVITITTVNHICHPQSSLIVIIIVVHYHYLSFTTTILKTNYNRYYRYRQTSKSIINISHYLQLSSSIIITASTKSPGIIITINQYYISSTVCHYHSPSP